jgi:hypothetical protein
MRLEPVCFDVAPAAQHVCGPGVPRASQIAVSRVPACLTRAGALQSWRLPSRAAKQLLPSRQFCQSQAKERPRAPRLMDSGRTVSPPALQRGGGMAQVAVVLMCGVGPFVVGGDAVVIPCDHPASLSAQSAPAIVVPRIKTPAVKNIKPNMTEEGAGSAHQEQTGSDKGNAEQHQQQPASGKRGGQQHQGPSSTNDTEQQHQAPSSTKGSEPHQQAPSSTKGSEQQHQR